MTPNKLHVRYYIVLFFNLKKSAAESRGLISETYGDDAEMLSHPAYFPDVAPSGYHLFRSRQHGFRHKHVLTYIAGLTEVEQRLRSLREMVSRETMIAKIIRGLPESIDAAAEYGHEASFTKNGMVIRGPDGSVQIVGIKKGPMTYKLMIKLRINGEVQSPQDEQAKFDVKTWKGILIGYGQSDKIYRIYDPQRRRVEVVCENLTR
ncbi:hypothetical protein X777_09798 [Ooceraea biroi]|uniref:Uncharacterized protein n=1 Tax=Ooceraea biroi TaxID=2015173 RepID=A0A026W675_OOCBI|nr:hypothetical protein X777_09798 [Ooceraea biroi]